MHIRGFEVQWTRGEINKGGVVEGCCGRVPPVGWGPSSHCSNLWLSVLLCGHHCLAEIYHSCQRETASNCHITQLKCRCDLALSGSLLPLLLLLDQMSSPCTIRNGTTTNKWNGCCVRVKQMSDRCVHIALTTGVFSLWGHYNVVMITLWRLWLEYQLSCEDRSRLYIKYNLFTCMCVCVCVGVCVCVCVCVCMYVCMYIYIYIYNIYIYIYINLYIYKVIYLFVVSYKFISYIKQQQLM